MAEVELTIAGRPYKVACRNGEEDTLRAAGALVDAKSREALAGLGTLSESRQLLFAALLLADQLVDGREVEIPTGPDPELVERTQLLAQRLESLADRLEQNGVEP
ncbi:cell division protein ZapA [Sphingomonas sp. NSE70-1]|uniref:Cell division protein ZapA n=1 Tax=Sphingomonas caseinilyticus TaxID=2908205 RepID=A0ABT0RS17_9SPHN|nr:cell division protein ZapA [Sphingomonas caseinilyticus]MCL6697802.1 cell division protein ZapA [Sphingomonas caseinilyticus]